VDGRGVNSVKEFHCPPFLAPFRRGSRKIRRRWVGVTPVRPSSPSDPPRGVPVSSWRCGDQGGQEGDRGVHGYLGQEDAANDHVAFCPGFGEEAKGAAGTVPRTLDSSSRIAEGKPRRGQAGRCRSRLTRVWR